MLTLLFWNMNRQDRRDVLSRMVVRHGIHILMLAECDLTPAEVLRALNQGDQAAFHDNGGRCEAVRVYSTFATEHVREVHGAQRYTIRHLQLPLRTDVLLAAAHLPSKLHRTDDSQRYTCADLAEVIREQEQRLGHRRTVLVGDFNMNPFEPPMVSAREFHAVMDRQTARGGSRMVEGKEYPYFYNPMWSLLGDASPGPPGTHYYARGDHVTYFWNMLDQVLVRPELLACFRNEDLEILTDDGTVSFLKKQTGRPNPKTASDHLPLLFRINLEKP
jgi:hypothetical protein